MPASRPPTLAVTLCNYNHGDVVGRAVEAILAQSRPPDEFVIVDDGSTDQSLARLEPLARDHPRVRLIRHPRNLGLNAAIETALQNVVSAEYLYMASSDDYVKPGFFEKAMAMAAAHPEAGIIFGRQNWAWPSGFEELQDELPAWAEPTYATPPRFLAEYLRRAPGLHSLTAATIYRRACLEEIGRMPPELGYWVDTFSTRAIALKYGACFIPSVCAVFSFNPDGFCGRQVRDLDKALAPFPHIVARMRSPEFADRFPPDYVDEWEREGRKDAVAFHCWLRYLAPAKEVRHRRRQALAPLGAIGRGLARVITAPRLGWAGREYRSALRALLAERGLA